MQLIPPHIVCRRAATLIVAAWLATLCVAAATHDRERHTPVQPATAAALRQSSQAAAVYMERVYNYGEANSSTGLQYSSEVYARHRMYTRRRGPIVRYIPGMLRLERGEHNYLTEAQLRMQYRPPGETDCRVVAYCSTARQQSVERLRELGRFNILIYDTKLFIDRILNPLNRRNRRFYRFAPIAATTPADSALGLVRISVTPRASNDQLVEGSIGVDPVTGAVRHFKFDLRYNLQRITIEARPGASGYESLVPEELRIFSRFRLLGNVVNEVIEIRSHHTFTCQLPGATPTADRRDLTSMCLVRLDTAHVITSPAYFDSVRPYPLRGSEEGLIAALAARQHHALSRYIDTITVMKGNVNISAAVMRPVDKPSDYQAYSRFDQRGTRNYVAEKTQRALLSSHVIKLGDEPWGRIKLPPVFSPSMVQWSGSRGLSLRTRLTFSMLNLKGDDRPLLSFVPSVGYSFKQRQVYFDLPLNVSFAPRYDGLITLKAGGGNRMYNSRQADELRERLKGVARYDSLMHIIDRYGFHDYLDSYANADVTMTPVPGLRLQAGLRFHRRTLIEWNELAATGGLTRRLTSLGHRLELEWTPALYYYRQGERRLPLYSRWPTLLMSYERGFAVGDSQTRYERIEGDLRYRLPLYAMRTIYLRAGAGVYIRKDDDCFLDYDYFRFSYVPEGWTDDLTGEMQLLSARWYNESRYYVRFNGTYESPMLLLSRIPGVSRVVQKERCYLNLLSVRSLGFYSELGYGFNSHLLDAGVFVGIAPDKSLSVGCKVALRFFDD